MKKRKGFTLVELVIIIAVIVILSAALIPSVSNLIDNSKKKNDKMLVDNMNAILMKENPKNTDEVLWLLSANDFKFDDPNYEHHVFYWHEEENIIVIYDNEQEKIVYLEDEVGTKLDLEYFHEVSKTPTDNDITENVYSVTYVVNGKKVNFKDKNTYKLGDEFDLKIPQLTGYTFNGWYDNAELSGTCITSIVSTDMGNKIFYASFTKDEPIINEYDITYYLDGGINPSDVPTKYDGTIEIVLPTPEKSGYTFIGWYENSEFTGSTVEKIAAGSTGNKAFYAKWQSSESVVEFDITYELNGGVLNNPVTKYDGTIVIQLPEPTREGYIFSGWYENAEFTSSTVEKIAVGSNGNKTFYAKWEDIREQGIYYITYVLNGGNQTNAPTKFDNSKNVYLFTPLQRGYVFEGWYVTSDFTGPKISVIEAGVYSEDITLYAKWTILEYPIIYELDGGECGYLKESYTIQDEVDLENYKPTKKGYYFKGWYDSPEGNQVTKINKNSTGVQTLYARWHAIEYTIYLYDEGTLKETIIYTVETPTFKLPSLTKEQKRFVGWFEKTVDGYNVGAPIKVIEAGTLGDIHLNSEWLEEGLYLIYLNCDGGKVEGDVITIHYKYVKSNESYKLPIPQKQGYVFVGWDLNGEILPNPHTFEDIENDFFLIAKWKKITE